MPVTRADREALAPAAARERDLREQHYPEQVRAGQLAAAPAALDPLPLFGAAA